MAVCRSRPARRKAGPPYFEVVFGQLAAGTTASVGERERHTASALCVPLQAGKLMVGSESPGGGATKEMRCRSVRQSCEDTASVLCIPLQAGKLMVDLESPWGAHN